MSTNRTSTMRQNVSATKGHAVKASNDRHAGVPAKFSPNLVGDDSNSSPSGPTGPTGEKMNVSPVRKVSSANGMYKHRRGGDGGI